MNHDESRSLPLESLLAEVLDYGCWIASAAITVGLVLALSAHHLAVLANMHLVTIGIALFILLPVLRVVLMLIVFLRERDYRFSAIAALVLTILLVGFVLGTRVPSAIAR
jgi:uncharacterized membrane protein